LQRYCVTYFTRPLDPQLRAKIAKKHRLWTRYMETRKVTVLKKYKSVRNAVKRDVQKIIKLE